MFRFFTYNLELSLLAITLLRNLAYVFYLLHWCARDLTDCFGGMKMEMEMRCRGGDWTGIWTLDFGLALDWTGCGDADQMRKKTDRPPSRPPRP